MDVSIALVIYLPLSQSLKPQHNEESVVPLTLGEDHIFEPHNRSSPKLLINAFFFIKINLDLLQFYLLALNAPITVYYSPEITSLTLVRHLAIFVLV